MAAYLPEGQATQVTEEVAPVALDAVPTGHNVQLDAPVKVEKLPEGQVTQVDDDVAPTALDAVPTGHSVQLDEPTLET